MTKAKLSAVFVALLLFLIGFMSGAFPPDLIKKAGIADFGAMTSALLVFHMGTMINIRQLVQEYNIMTLEEELESLQIDHDAKRYEADASKRRSLPKNNFPGNH